MLGPSGTGKSVFLKTLIGLLKPDKGSIVIRDVDVANCSESKLYETRKLFGVLFQDGALFGSMNLFDNIAFPLREHTKKSEKQIADIVSEKLEMVGLTGTEKKLPGEISGGMRKRAGLARALVLEPGDHPVRRAGLRPGPGPRGLPEPADHRSERAVTDATFLIVTHDIGTARTVPDNLGHAVQARAGHVRPARGAAHLRGAGGQAVPQRPPRGPDRHVRGEGLRPGRVRARRDDRRRPARPPGTGPKGASGSGVPPQIPPSPGLPERKAVARRQKRVLDMLHTLPQRPRPRSRPCWTRSARKSSRAARSPAGSPPASARPRPGPPTQTVPARPA